MTWSRQARAKARTEPLSGVVSGQDTETVERFPTERDVTALMEATKALTAKQARCALEAASAYVWARAVPASVLAAARTELDEAKAERDGWRDHAYGEGEAPLDLHTTTRTDDEDEYAHLMEAELAAARAELDEAKAAVAEANSAMTTALAVVDDARKATAAARAVLSGPPQQPGLREALQLLRNLVGDVRGMQSDGATPEQMDKALGDAICAVDAVLSGSPQPEPKEETREKIRERLDRAAQSLYGWLHEHVDLDGSTRVHDELATIHEDTWAEIVEVAIRAFRGEQDTRPWFTHASNLSGLPPAPLPPLWPFASPASSPDRGVEPRPAPVSGDERLREAIDTIFAVEIEQARRDYETSDYLRWLGELRDRVLAAVAPLSVSSPDPVEEDGAALIAAERARQVAVEGWTQGHDDAHIAGALRAAARAYASDPTADSPPPDGWPWEASAWKPGDPVRNLVKAGALLAAEIDRLTRILPQGDELPSKATGDAPDPVEGKLYPCAPVEGTNPGDAGEIDAVYALLDTHFTRADPEEPGGPPTWGRSSGYFDPEWDEAGEDGSTIAALRQLMEDEFVRGVYEDSPALEIQAREWADKLEAGEVAETIASLRRAERAAAPGARKLPVRKPVSGDERLREALDEAFGLLDDLTDPDPCQYDHNDLCQAHYLDKRPCPVARAQELLAGRAVLSGSPQPEPAAPSINQED